MRKPYHSLLIRDAGKWSVQFGDYDLEVVIGEREAYCDGAENVKRKDTKIITTHADQASINARVAALNGSA